MNPLHLINIYNRRYGRMKHAIVCHYKKNIRDKNMDEDKTGKARIDLGKIGRTIFWPYLIFIAVLLVLGASWPSHGQETKMRIIKVVDDKTGQALTAVARGAPNRAAAEPAGS